MKRNEGNLDRVARLALGLGLLGATWTGSIGPWGWIGIVPVITAGIGWCPLYQLLGINTCGVRR